MRVDAKNQLSISTREMRLIIQMQETLDWYLYRFRDRHVLAEVKNRRIVQQQPGAISFGHRPLAIEIPYTIEELSEQLKRNRSSIGKSLERLHDHDKIEPHKGGWRLK